ncbi:MAG: hypothetical protein U5O39_08960 [Gammaproteobacteria bacterium]|nr:hypothetical protein [Gammaproteobacteria bacterium]
MRASKTRHNVHNPTEQCHDRCEGKQDGIAKSEQREVNEGGEMALSIDGFEAQVHVDRNPDKDRDGERFGAPDAFRQKAEQRLERQGREQKAVVVDCEDQVLDIIEAEAEVEDFKQEREDW